MQALLVSARTGVPSPTAQLLSVFPTQFLHFKCPRPLPASHFSMGGYRCSAAAPPPSHRLRPCTQAVLAAEAQQLSHSRRLRWRGPAVPRQTQRRRRGSSGDRCRRAGGPTAATAVPADGFADADSSSQVAGTRSRAERFAAFRAAFWKFLRPHTIRGTILGATAITSRALLENQQYIDWGLLPRALLGVLALVCGNGYIVGINQIYDVSVDTVNKPYLPIAAGELSPALAWLLVMGLAAAGLAITSTNFGSLITALYGLGLFLGTIYSVPPLHLKRFAVPAFLIIATVRGVLLNFGVYYAARAALGLTEFQWSPAIGFITAFVTVFATVIALTKDLPDIVGDRQHGIQTFATMLGAPRLTALAVTLLLSNYIAAGVLAVRMPAAFRQQFMIAAHAVLAGLLLRAWRAVHMAGYSKSAIAGFYRAIWNLFYSEYFIFPLL